MAIRLRAPFNLIATEHTSLYRASLFIRSENAPEFLVQALQEWYEATTADVAAARQALPFDRPVASAYPREHAAGAYLDPDSVRGDTVRIRLRLGEGPGCGTAWGCVLSDQ